MSERSAGGDPFYLVGLAVPALLSFALFRVFRAFLERAKSRYAAAHPESCRLWQVFSQEFIDKPLVLPLLMTSAPRWNPHAVIGTFGPMMVRDRIAIDGAAARQSGEWFFVIYRHPDRLAVGSISHLTDTGAAWEEFAVPRPGWYAIGARYYHPAPTVVFPAVRADGVAIGEPRPVPSEVNRFYRELQSRQSALYRCLAYYVWFLLRCRSHLPAAWVHRELLPVGNPETEFLYGIFRRHEPIVWPFTGDSCQNSDVYVTLYSKCSLPISWFEWSSATALPTLPAPVDGFFLVRIQPRRPATQPPRSRPAPDHVAVDIAPGPLPNRPLLTS